MALQVVMFKHVIGAKRAQDLREHGPRRFDWEKVRRETWSDLTNLKNWLWNFSALVIVLFGAKELGYVVDKKDSFAEIHQSAALRRNTSEDV